jgi:hypothetical protein
MNMKHKLFRPNNIVFNVHTLTQEKSEGNNHGRVDIYEGHFQTSNLYFKLQKSMIQVVRQMISPILYVLLNFV